MIEITATTEWQNTFPGSSIGLLEISGVDNTAPAPTIDRRKMELVEQLREKYARQTRADLLNLPVMAANNRYYRQFDKTCHVLLQLESLVFKGKNLPSVSPLVDSYFIAEMETLILTAGHDVNKLSTPVVIDVSSEQDEITQMSGQTRRIHAGDMMMRDRLGLRSTILYGQDKDSPITSTTRNALFVSYAPVGVPTEAVEQNFSLITEYVKSFSPTVKVEQSLLIHA